MRDVLWRARAASGQAATFGKMAQHMRAAGLSEKIAYGVEEAGFGPLQP